MSQTIHARLDETTAEIRDQLKRSQGWTDSEIVRRGIKMLSAMTPKSGRKHRFRGVGKYNSGVTDLATNKKHMEGFGE